MHIDTHTICFFNTQTHLNTCMCTYLPCDSCGDFGHKSGRASPNATPNGGGWCCPRCTTAAACRTPAIGPEGSVAQARGRRGEDAVASALPEQALDRGSKPGALFEPAAVGLRPTSTPIVTDAVEGHQRRIQVKSQPTREPKPLQQGTHPILANDRQVEPEMTPRQPLQRKA